MSQSTLYLNESGRPRLRESVTAFIDVLGFSQTVLATAEAGQSQQCLDRIVAALEGSRAAVRNSVPVQELAEATPWAVKFFSDNLLLGTPCDEHEGAAAATAFVLRCAQLYQLQMVLDGFFVRGALTLGPLCVTEDVIFGTSLIDAYQLESKAAIVPRIILSEQASSAVVSQFGAKDNRVSNAASDLLCRDIDGWWFVNYLQAAVEPGGVNWQKIGCHKESVMASLAHSTRHDILPKFGWVSRYHNVFCHWHRDDPGYSEQHRIKRVDEESVIERLRR